MASNKQKIAVLFPAFLGGGAEAVCLWMLEGLKHQYEVTLFTFSEVDFPTFNDYYGTSISADEVHVIKLPTGRLFGHLFVQSYSLFSLRQNLLIRYFKCIASEFNCSISAFNEMDMGLPGIQYIHFPMFACGHEPARKIVGYPDSKVRKVYRSLCQRISSWSDANIRKNLTVANSEWTARVIKDVYGIDAYVIYPPVVGDFEDVAWKDKEDGFVCIARFVPEKKVERAIRILQMVRACGFDIHLHIVSGAGDQRYEKFIEGLIAENSGWVFMKRNLSRKELVDILTKHKYGIHTRDNEQFGIVVAEMEKAGCIPFVPSQGGQVEIVGDHELLTFSDEDEAVKKIVKVLINSEMQRMVRHSLSKKALMFSPYRFTTEIQGLVSSFLQQERGRKVV